MTPEQVTPSGPTLAAALAVGLVFVNAGAVSVFWRRLSRRYYRLGAPSPSSLVWIIMIAGAATIYGGRRILPFGWGVWASSLAPVHDAASLLPMGAILFTLGSAALLVDAQTRRLPNLFTYLMIGEALLVLTAMVPFTAPAPSWSVVILASEAVWVIPLTVGYALGQVGFGDVKLSVSLAAVLGSTSFGAAAAGVLIAFTFAGVGGLIRYLKGQRHTRFALGPCMISASMVVWAWAALGTLVLR